MIPEKMVSDFALRNFLEDKIYNKKKNKISKKLFQKKNDSPAKDLEGL